MVPVPRVSFFVLSIHIYPCNKKKFTYSFQIVQFHENKHFTVSATLQKIFYTPQCILGDLSSSRFDIMVALVTGDDDGNQTFLFISQCPFVSWATLSFNAVVGNNGKILDVAFDHGRNRIIVFTEVSGINIFYYTYSFKKETVKSFSTGSFLIFQQLQY